MPRLALPVARLCVARALPLWLVARATLLVLFVLQGGGALVREAFVAAPLTAAPFAVAGTVLLGAVDLRQWGQRTLLANLGVDAPTVAALHALAALAGELALVLGARLAR